MVAEDVSKRVFVTAAEAQDRMRELAARVESGETVCIMRDGEVEAELRPKSEPPENTKEQQEAVLRWWEELRELRKKEPTGITREEMLSWRHEGHKR